MAFRDEDLVVVRGGVEPPTFRFSGVADGQVVRCCQRVDDCRGVPMAGVGSQRCRHRCRQIPVIWLSKARSRGLRHELGDSGLFAPKPTCRPRWLHYISPDLGTTVIQRPLGVSAAVGGDCYSLVYSVARGQRCRTIDRSDHLDANYRQCG
jgi:hypothetical protein